ncbi:MAG TPA: amidohydrolase family protein [Candidatus Polarisedimenticolia bacterium]|nr:amidohydrolase family protein [Candidatus Polarisedimenticolia bacterium]
MRCSALWLARIPLLTLLLWVPAPLAPHASGAEGDDLSAARSLFEANLAAIRKRDRDAYLACYLPSPNLARTGPGGVERGFDSLAKETGAHWPDFFEGLDLQLVPVRQGLVYGSYRFRVRYADVEQAGISERFFVRTPEGWRIAVTSAFASEPGTPPAPRALTGATLLDGRGGTPMRDSVVILRGGKIECAGKRSTCPVPEGMEILDLTGNWITPGIVDAHVHFSQTGWADGRPDALDVRKRFPYEEVEAGLRAHPERFLRSYLCSGVTAVFDVGGYPWTWDLRRRFEKDLLAPHVAAAGPLLSTWDFWLNLPAERQFIYLGKEADALSGVQYLASHHSDAVKIWFIPVRDRDFEEMARLVSAAGEEARRRKLPLIVHATGLREAKAALKAGARLLVHSVDDVQVDEEFLKLAREKETLYCPTLTVFDGYRRLAEASEKRTTPAVDDPAGCVDSETLEHLKLTSQFGMEPSDPEAARRRREYFENTSRVSRGNLKAVHQAGIPIAMGTDAGNPLTLHGVSVYKEMEAMQASGMKPMEVLTASTRNGALAMHRLEEFGTVEAGKVADLLVVSADPSRDIKNLRHLRYVVRGGVVRPLDELRARSFQSP